MTIAGFLGKGVEWAIFPGFGVILGIYFATAVLADGSLTIFSGGVNSVMVSAATAQPWQFISLLSVMIVAMPGMAAMWKVAESLG